MPKNKRGKKKVTMAVGQAYSEWLTPVEQEAQAAGCDILIDHLFADIATLSAGQRENDAHLWLASFLPRRYLPKYTPLFCKMFAVCAITVAWKLAQPEHLPLSSVAEELAAWAILTEAKAFLELESAVENTDLPAETLELFRIHYFEDEDFLFLFEDAFDGIDAGPVGQATCVCRHSPLTTGSAPFPMSHRGLLTPMPSGSDNSPRNMYAGLDRFRSTHWCM